MKRSKEIIMTDTRWWLPLVRRNGGCDWIRVWGFWDANNVLFLKQN